MIPLEWWLIVAAALFCIGLYGVLSRKNAIGILMGIELMLNAVNINLVAFWRYVTPGVLTGQVFAIIVITVAAAEAAVGLAIVIAAYRRRDTVIVDDLDININFVGWRVLHQSKGDMHITRGGESEAGSFILYLVYVQMEGLLKVDLRIDM